MMTTTNIHRSTTLPRLPGSSFGLLIVGGLIGAIAAAPLFAAEGATAPGEHAAADRPVGEAQGLYDLLTRLQARQQSMEQELARLNETNRALEQENRLLRADVQAAAERAAALEARLNEAETESVGLERALRGKELQLAELRGQMTRLEQFNTEAESARGRLAEENVKLSAAFERERSAGKAAQHALRDQLAALQQGMSEEKQRLEAELVQLRGQQDTLKQDLTTAREGRAQASSRVADLEAELQTLHGLHAQSLAAVDGGIQRAEAAEARVAALGAAQKALIDERDALKKRLDDTQARLAELAQQLEAQRKGHAQAAAEAAETRSALEGERSELRLALDASKAKVSDLEIRVKTLEEEHALAAAAAEANESKLASEKAELETEQARLREELEDLTQRHKVLEETHSGAVTAMERLQKDKAQIQTALEEEQKRSEELQSSLDETHKQMTTLKREIEAAAAEAAADRDRKQAENESLAEELQKVKQAGADESRSLREKLSVKEGEIGELSARLSGLQAALGRTESELMSIRGRLPAAAGGSVTDEQAKRNAAEQMLALREIYKKRSEMEKVAWEQERKRLEQAVRDAQFMLAQSMSARSVYRVQRDDTLAKISLEVYGKANRWPEIYEANRHLLEDPDRVFPGMSLVIP